MTAAKAPPLTRTIRVSGLDEPQDLDRVNEALAAVAGVRAVASARGGVRVTYDPTEVRLEMLEGELTNMGHALSDGWLDRLRRAWSHFSEQNVVDNLNHEGHCCAKPPKGA